MRYALDPLAAYTALRYAGEAPAVGESTLSDDNAVRLTNNRGIDEYPDWQPVPICTKKGTSGNDRVVGTANRDVLCGGAGNDVLIGGTGIHNGGTGIDTCQTDTGDTKLNCP